MEERLQKLLAQAGLCSRREAERWITDGRVTVNGRTASVGDKADLRRDKIMVDGRPLGGSEEKRYLMLYKPRGYVTTLKDERGRKTVADLVHGCGARVVPVGRLDYNSEGLLLLSNDGDLVNGLTHPRHEVEKHYEVRVRQYGQYPAPFRADGARRLRHPSGGRRYHGARRGHRENPHDHSRGAQPPDQKDVRKGRP